MSVDISPLSNDDIKKWFDSPGTVPANTFELALVLGGTVSSGAYTAGAIDFLIEALDAWTAARDAGDTSVPRHRVVIRVISGNSGGAVCAAIATRALAYRFPHVRKSTDATTAAGNPLYDTWVNQLSLDAMLTNTDLEAQDSVPLSLLNGKAIDAAAAKIIDFTATPMQRDYLGYQNNPLRLILCFTNLNGTPYRIDFSQQAVGDGPAADLYEPYINHADHARFAVIYPGQVLAEPRPDEFVLDFNGGAAKRPISWQDFGQYACASSAFPIGFPPRRVKRPLTDYRYRVEPMPDDHASTTGQADPDDDLGCIPLNPDWQALQDWFGAGLPDDCSVLAVDGGVTDNEPIELARVALAGVNGRNPRNGLKANRGVVLIDPFAGSARMPAKSATTDLTIAKLLGDLVTILPQQTRYDSRDLLLATHPDVYSRFMIAACGRGFVGDKALATAGLDAFLGFACEAFRRYDYLLGRRNCQDFLRKTLVLPEQSAVFANCMDGVPLDEYVVSDSSGRYLPLIPLVGDLAKDEELDPWPKGTLDPAIYRDAIKERYGRLVEKELHGSLVKEIIAWAAKQFGQEKIADIIIGKLNDALKAQDLA